MQQPHSVIPVGNRKARVVVVGGGTAALSALKALKHHGYQHVQVIAPAQDFGGKCVNLGCMPSEFILHRSEGLNLADPLAQTTLRDELNAFTAGLSRDVEQQFRNLGYPLIDGYLDRIEGNEVVLTSASPAAHHGVTRVPFDRLVLAIGNHVPPPAWQRQGIAPESEFLQLEEIWNLPAGQRILITAENNPTALGLAVIARRMGHQVTIALTGPNPLATLPSFKHYLREVRKLGISIKDGFRIQQFQAGSVQLESAHKSDMLAYDRVLIADRPLPNIPIIDGQRPALFDFDLVSSTWPHRPDICLVGDVGGHWTASAAETQAQRLINSWHDRKSLDHHVLERLPLRLHGAPGLAMVGPLWTLTATSWHEVDFRALGWSRIHRCDGKIWYCLEPNSDKIAAIHCCHADADNLIALARILLDRPVTDSCWDASSVHPSSAEIFKLVADHARQIMAPAAAPDLSEVGEPTPHLDRSSKDRASITSQQSIATMQQFQAPQLADIAYDDLPAWLGRERHRRALLSANPQAYVAACMAVAKLPGNEPQRAGLVIQVDRDGRLKIEGATSVQIEHRLSEKSIQARLNHAVVTVNY